jgi:hypothetical protein
MTSRGGEPLSAWKPHAKFLHVFVILRVDEYDGLEVPLEERIVVTKVMSTEEAAQIEVERLNRLNSGKSCRYLLKVARLVGEPPELRS